MEIHFLAISGLDGSDPEHSVPYSEARSDVFDVTIGAFHAALFLEVVSYVLKTKNLA